MSVTSIVIGAGALTAAYLVYDSTLTTKAIDNSQGYAIMPGIEYNPGVEETTLPVLREVPPQCPSDTTLGADGLCHYPSPVNTEPVVPWTPCPEPGFPYFDEAANLCQVGPPPQPPPEAPCAPGDLYDSVDNVCWPGPTNSQPLNCANGYTIRNNVCVRGHSADIGLSDLPVAGAIVAEIALSQASYAALSQVGSRAARPLRPVGRAAANAARSAAQAAARSSQLAAQATRAAAAATRAIRASTMMARLASTPFGLIFMALGYILIAVLGLNPEEFELCRDNEFDLASLPDWARILIESIPFAGDVFGMLGPTMCIRQGCEDGQIPQHGLCYTPPRPGWWCEAFLCYSQHPEWENNGMLHTTTHITKSVRTDTGTIPNACKENQVMSGAFCYTIPDWGRTIYDCVTNNVVTQAAQHTPARCDAPVCQPAFQTGGDTVHTRQENRNNFGFGNHQHNTTVTPIVQHPEVCAAPVCHPEVNVPEVRGDVETCVPRPNMGVTILAGIARENCRPGFTDTLYRCENVQGGGVGVQRQCPDGYHADGVTCRRPPRDYQTPCAAGQFDRARSCWRQNCTCVGGCHGRCVPGCCGCAFEDCTDVIAQWPHERDRHVLLDVIAAGAGSTLPCAQGLDVGYDGLCYPACPAGFRREGLLCTASYDKRVERDIRPEIATCPNDRIDGAPFGSAGLCYMRDLPAGFRRVVAGTIEQFCPPTPEGAGQNNSGDAVGNISNLVDTILGGNTQTVRDIGVACQRATYNRGGGRAAFDMRIKARRNNNPAPVRPMSCSERRAIFANTNEAGQDTWVGELCIEAPCAEDEDMSADFELCLPRCRDGYHRIERDNKVFCARANPADEYPNREPRPVDYGFE